MKGVNKVFLYCKILSFHCSFFIYMYIEFDFKLFKYRAVLCICMILIKLIAFVSSYRFNYHANELTQIFTKRCGKVDYFF